jgi:hypothetical protein
LNSIWNKNIRFFRARFRDLYTLYEPIFSEPDPQKILPSDCERTFSLIETKNGSITIRENGILLHSAYNPIAEAEKIAAALIEPEAPPNTLLVFYGFGLGYLPNAAAKQFPDSPFVLIEPDVRRFALALSVLDWEAVFSHRICVLLIGASEQTVLGTLESKLFGENALANAVFADIPALQAHAADYFSALKEIIRRNIQKQRINRNTSDKFGALWRRNTARNMDVCSHLDGVHKFAGKAQGLSACVFAAGPSLEQLLPLLPEIKKRCILICVDTALRSCLRAGVEPDFIVLADAQFWNARHLDGLRSPSSVLVTEVAVYPTVMRFVCKETVLFDSAYPAGKEFEKRFGSKGALGTGGSVATTAWDFARFLGCREIFLAALDLGFPHKRSHARGSTFESQSHRESSRLAPAETFGARALIAAKSVPCTDSNGNPVLSDERLRLYAWWFESKVAEFPQVKTWSLTAESRAIPGVEFFAPEKLLARQGRECACSPEEHGLLP